MKRLALVVAVLVLVGLLVVARGRKGSDVVCIVFPVTIDSFQRMEAACRQQLTANGYELRSFSAEGDQAKFATAVKGALLQRPALLITVGSQVADTALGAQFRGALPPMIASAISEPRNVQSLVDAGIAPPRSADLAIVSDQPQGDIYGQFIELMTKTNRPIKRIGVLFNPGEVNSKGTADGVREAAVGAGLVVLDGALHGAADVQPVTRDLLRKGVDAMVIPHDKAAVAAAATIVRLCEGEAPAVGVPVFSLDDGTVAKSGVVGAVSVDYGTIGEMTGHLAVKALKDGLKLSDQPVEAVQQATIYLNAAAQERLGLEIDQTVQREAKVLADK